jgi:hypothetical protein
MTKYATSAAVVILLSASAAGAADGVSGAWAAGSGPGAQTYVFKVRGDRFDGIVCGPCDDPKTVFRIEDGRVVDAEHLTFSIRYDVGGPLFAQSGPYRSIVAATRAGTQLTLRAQKQGDDGSAATTVLTRVVQNFGGLSLPAASNVAASNAAQGSPSPIDGKWVAAGRVSQQNFILKVRGGTLWGLVCGPCNPDGVFMIDDGRVDGDALTFYINHMDTPVSPQQTGLRRNIMRGTLTGNVMKFRWVREGAEDQPGGEMTLIGPIR